MRFELSLITCGRPRMTLITGDLFILSLFLLQLLPAHALGYILAGTVATCDNEGEKVDIPFTLGNPCLNCECKNREVICIQNKCPAKMKNCGLVVRSPEECCGHCRECVLDGIVHNTSTSSSLINSSSCTLYSCQGGVLTKSTRRCVVPCTDPLKVHSRCCPVCPGCSFNGLEYKDGQHFSLHNDPCIKCRCLDRMVQCERNMCPLLPCFPNATYIPEGECCPHCNDQVRISDLQDGTCLLHNKVYRDGESINIDNCTSCVCKGSTMVCFHHCRKNGSCRAPENCCHMCVSYVQPLETHCRVNNSIYQDGDQLPSSPCMTCTCRTGKTKCQRFKCPTRKVCPHGQHLEQTQLECCPKCVNKPGVCTVFGDPHYRTFDGKTFNFQGPCRYTLVRDCTRAELFSVIVQNDARNTHYFAWTKAVELWLGPTTIELLPRLRLRFNGSHAVLPLVTPSLNITTSGFLLKVSTSIGLTVTWDGKSYAEVAMTSRWRSRVCGLCGNYNGHYRDELLGQNGYFHADVESFAESWRVDDNEVCARPTRSHLPNVCTGSGKKRRRARRLCRKLISWGFHKCHAIVDLLPFYKSCMMDMCECPKKQRCYCEAFLAYTRACEREGVRIRWDVKQRCHGWL